MLDISIKKGGTMNHIIDVLKIKDKNIKIINCEIIGTNQIVTLEKELEEHICPKCASKMYSKGIKVTNIPLLSIDLPTREPFLYFILFLSPQKNVKWLNYLINSSPVSEAK